MSANNSPPQPAKRPISYPLLGLTILIALAVGGVLQEARWRGAFTRLFPSPLETPAQQLKLAQSAFKNGNNAVALSFFEPLASQNNTVAEYWLAHMTELGLGVPSDIPKAISLYEKAAAQNFVAAQVRLGEIYLNGNLVAPDYAKAFALLETAARQGNPRGDVARPSLPVRSWNGSRPHRKLRLVGSRRPGRTFLRQDRARRRLHVHVSV